MKIHFKKYLFSGSAGGYFSTGDPVLLDSLSLTRFFEIPRLNKQLTNPDNLQEIQYGDVDIKIDLLSGELTASGSSIERFFTALQGEEDDASWLCIIDSAGSRWAGMVYLPIEWNLTYSLGDSFVNVRAVHLLAEFKKIAELKILQPLSYGLTDLRFNDWVQNYMFGDDFFLAVDNRFEPAVSPATVTKLSVPLYNKIVGDPTSPIVFNRGGHTITKYEFFKRLSLVWGIMWDIIVPDNYETEMRPLMEFRLYRRGDGEEIVPQWIEFNYRQMPKAKKWVFVKQREWKQDIRVLFPAGFDTFTIAKGILFNTETGHIYDGNNGGLYPTPFFSLNGIGKDGSSGNPANVEREDCKDRVILVNSIGSGAVFDPSAYPFVLNEDITFVNSTEEMYEMAAGMTGDFSIGGKLSLERLFVVSWDYRIDSIAPYQETYADQYNNTQSSPIRIINELASLLITRNKIVGVISGLNNVCSVGTYFKTFYNGIHKIYSIIKVENEDINSEVERLLCFKIESIQID
ncbi:MAG: hypothetical protein K8I03_14595 [Ignavibacteria bacterium]|nr:hypothetical protein [Ignavibacteria bacterium]